MKISTLVLGALETNCYIIADGGNAVVIDPACDADGIAAFLKREGLKLSDILLTHGHFDHTGAADGLKRATGAGIWLHEADAPMLNDAGKSSAAFMPQMFKVCEADRLFKGEEDVFERNRIKLDVLSTPGHSAGSVLYLLHNGENIMFSGDTLFAGSVGRVDGWGGSAEAQKLSLEKINGLNADYRVLPGHGESTALHTEKKRNPYLRGL